MPSQPTVPSLPPLKATYLRNLLPEEPLLEQSILQITTKYKEHITEPLHKSLQFQSHLSFSFNKLIKNVKIVNYQLSESSSVKDEQMDIKEDVEKLSEELGEVLDGLQGILGRLQGDFSNYPLIKSLKESTTTADEDIENSFENINTTASGIEIDVDSVEQLQDLSSMTQFEQDLGGDITQMSVDGSANAPEDSVGIDAIPVGFLNGVNESMKPIDDEMKPFNSYSPEKQSSESIQLTSTNMSKLAISGYVEEVCEFAPKMTVDKPEEQSQEAEGGDIKSKDSKFASYRSENGLTMRSETLQGDKNGEDDAKRLNDDQEEEHVHSKQPEEPESSTPMLKESEASPSILNHLNDTQTNDDDILSQNKVTGGLSKQDPTITNTPETQGSTQLKVEQAYFNTNENSVAEDSRGAIVDIPSLEEQQNSDHKDDAQPTPDEESQSSLEEEEEDQNSDEADSQDQRSTEYPRPLKEGEDINNHSSSNNLTLRTRSKQKIPNPPISASLQVQNNSSTIGLHTAPLSPTMSVKTRNIKLSSSPLKFLHGFNGGGFSASTVVTTSMATANGVNSGAVSGTSDEIVKGKFV